MRLRFPKDIFFKGYLFIRNVPFFKGIGSPLLYYIISKLQTEDMLSFFSQLQQAVSQKQFKEEGIYWFTNPVDAIQKWLGSE